MRVKRKAYKVFVGKEERKRSLGSLRFWLEEIIEEI
jgi:hypothetical protein